MARPASEYPTELELEMLKVLWNESPQMVSDIREQLAIAGRKMAHTTTITMLNIMVDKRYLKKKKDGKTFLYWPIVKEEDVSQRMLSDLVNRVFDGSTQRLVLNLIDGQAIDEEELIELRKLINQKVREQRE